ncbi:M17 family metallopeptidase [Pseudofrankia sp. BMG5.37]|uniref:leucyl aminopeptidase family protein n=1 Tax=Pseudofrankia sp. BMG5.37 TaxID=3050035 RepID=UPI002893870D|nr:M17 family metallopeptidase [Pseudofrankia sp. BMG5.37]MDT3441230.1 M17 family metallopeptidase [Pseudofrankia sp. BMG5.37]
MVTLRPGGPAAPDSSALAVVVLSSEETASDGQGGSGEAGTAGSATVRDGYQVSPIAGAACAELGINLDALLTTHTFGGDAGSVLLVPLARAEPPARLLLVGAGTGSGADWRSAGAALARRAGAGDRVALVADPDSAALAAFTEGLALASYRQPRGAGKAASDVTAASADAEVGDLSAGQTDLRGDERVTDAVDAADASRETDEVSPAEEPAVPVTGPERGHGVDEVIVWTSRALTPTELAEAAEAVRRAGVLARAVLTARDLVNMPSLVKSPEWLAARAVAAARAAGLDASLMDVRELEARGFGGLVAVGAASVRPPYLVELRYDGPPTADGAELGHRVLVGKGITFDSGGLSLKPAGSMAGMKTDMSGAAAVLATMVALPELGAPGRVTGLLCIAENMIGAAAMRPGDVITCWGGRTVEVLNTDAEGRLVLADGLAYAAGALGADLLVDLATLTGAISVALGRRTAGLFASDDALADGLTAAAAEAGERVWRLPLVEEYRPALESPVADLANIGRALDVGGGSITAALFLREFTDGLPWAHLDIAGTARADSDDAEITRGGTGWGVRTLLRWLTTAAAPTAADSSVPAAVPAS